jgi:DNA-binding transcriptional ArsR family regulator
VDDAVFRALAHPARRLLLDQLFAQDGLSLGQLQAALPEMTRFGVMKHLRVLGEAGLVTTKRVGRERHHFLNAVPIREMHDRWLDRYRARAAAVLLDLETRGRGSSRSPTTGSYPEARPPIRLPG